MSEQPGNQKDDDELLAKLDNLLKRHRASEDAQSLPTLVAPIAGSRDDIPVLTDAVSGPAVSRVTSEPPPDAEAVIETRLSAAIGREVMRLQAEMPQHARQLAALSITLTAAVKLLIERYFKVQTPEGRRGGDPGQRS